MWEVWPYKVFFSCPPTKKERPISLLGEMWMKKRICELKGDERHTTFVKLCGWRRKKKPGESLNSNCNLPFERGEIFFTTNYLPMCLCIGVSYSLIGSDPPHEYLKDRRRLWTSRGVLVDIVIFWHVSIGSVQDDAPSECPRHHVWTSSWTRIFSFRFEILNLNKKRPQDQQIFLKNFFGFFSHFSYIKN